MARSHDTMMTPPIEGLLERVDSKFGLVTLAARRARNINSYFNQLGDGLGSMIPPQVSSTSRKPLSIAFEEISSDKIVPTEPSVAVDETFELPEGDADLSAEASAAGNGDGTGSSDAG
jgi:DNA-directed RNA polymerase subunit omega